MLAVWIISLAIFIPELVVLDVHVRFKPELTGLLTTCKPVGWTYGQQAAYQFFLSVAIFFVPVALMAFAYFRIASTLWLNVIPVESGKSNSPCHLSHLWTPTLIVSPVTPVDIHPVSPATLVMSTVTPVDFHTRRVTCHTCRLPHSSCHLLH